jgi:predicted anti-sigma-YlaC factor YlaD
MDCTHARIAISAQLDGEEPGAPPEALAAHLAGCATCRAWRTQATGLHRRVRVAAAPPVPDLTSRVLGAIGAEREAGTSRDRALRLGLALVGLMQIVFAAPGLLLGEEAGLTVHSARHLGSFAFALGVGFLVAAWRPSRVSGVLPMAAALVACIAVTTVLDVASGRVGSGEASHVTEFVGLAALFVLDREVKSNRAVMAPT